MSRPTRICTSLHWSAWGQQWGAILGAFTVLVAMIILLNIFDGKPVFSWNGITLNTITSILSVTVKAATLFVVAECMAQWKWILFAQEQRPLIDFDRLDGATRGPMGSLRLLLKTRGAFIVRFGAILTLVALALDPFAQQLVQLREDISFEAIESKARVPKAQSYSSGEFRFDGASAIVWTNDTASGKWEQVSSSSYSFTANVSATMGAAISGGFFKSLEDVHRERFYYCLTGQCTFAPFLTLGICHKSNDITSKLMPSGTDQDFNMTLRAFETELFGYPRTQNEDEIISAFILPNGHFIANTDGIDPVGCENCRTYLATSFGTENPKKTVSMRHIDTLIWSMSLVYLDIKAYSGSKPSNEGGFNNKIWPNIPIVASESALYYCVKNVNATVVANKLEEEVTEVVGVTRTNDSWDAAFLGSQDHQHIQAPPDEIHALAFRNDTAIEFYNDLRLQVPGHSETFSVKRDAVLCLSAHFHRLFRWAEWHNSTKVREQLEAVPGMAKAVAFNAAYYGPRDQLWTAQDARSQSLGHFISLARFEKFHEAEVIEVMAESMTNEIRRSSITGDGLRNRSDTTLEEGQTGVVVVLYRVEWPWIGLHAAVLAAACLFMVLTVWSSGRSDEIPLWKSSSLGAIRRGHDIGDQLANAGDQIADMEAMARKLKVKAYRHDVDEASPTMGR